ncbi:MAG: hypothetical protein IJI73_00100 [Kiritimatiellae bacterium]|nr:hypothetical protein [Kiritimatiellia bacterium]
MRGGQVAVFLIMTLVVILLLALLNVDTFVAVRAKNRLQNGGDAAAIAAARRQGSLLNEIGRLNIRHALAAVRNDAAGCEEAVMLQRRLALLGPVDALRLANEAALKNKMEVRDEFSIILREHVMAIRTVYSGGGGAGEPYPEPYPGAWADYASAIDGVISGGLAVGPDNVEFYDAAAGHLLLNRQFYYAIAGSNWCWFHFNAENVLRSYGSYRDWGPLPSRRENSLDNSEIFSLHVTAYKGALTELFSKAEILELLRRYGEGAADGFDFAKKIEDSLLVSDKEQVWFLYDPYHWRRWFNGTALADDEDGYEFPVVGEVKPEYNVRGCAAICRCVSRAVMTSTDTESDLSWSAAAKPFGTVESIEGQTDVANALRNFVVPCFTSARLVPVDSVGGENLATADFGWVHHIRHHLGPYLEHGPRGAEACFYCIQLMVWEREEFRRAGIKWLETNAGGCVRGTGGHGGHGGTSHGH